MRYASLVVWLFLCAGTASAVDGEDMPASPEYAGPGGGTRSWLNLQRSGQAAAPVRPLPGPVASRIYRRYLESFDHPVPVFFERERGMMPAN